MLFSPHVQLEPASGLFFFVRSYLPIMTPDGIFVSNSLFFFFFFPQLRKKKPKAMLYYFSVRALSSGKDIIFLYVCLNCKTPQMDTLSY